jgi:cytochrome c oxidase assembly protein subunit 11
MDKNTRSLTMVLGLAGAMIVLSFASVPLYNLFCRMTGFGGTIQVSTEVPDKILDRKITIKFNADVAPNMPWAFKPDQRQITVNVGQQQLIAYHARNKSKMPVAGTAIYNVSPSKAGKYFHKTQCFCFDSQLLKPGEDMEMPVVFFVDPSIQEDEDLEDLSTITLSYTFFPADSKELDAALEAFYNADEAGIENSKKTSNISN